MKQGSQAQVVYLEMRRQILIAHLQPNERLKEDNWAKSMKVSRMAIREALNRLLGEGLVVTKEKGGYFVTCFGEEDIRQIREIREILELAALRISFDKITPNQIKELEKICNDFTQMIDKGYVSGACEADIKFHETLVALSGNERLSSAYHHSHIPLFHQKIGKTRYYLDDYRQTEIEHSKIVNAIKSKNLKLAEKTLSSHIKRGERAVLGLEDQG